ncbi:MAG: cache domain-containing protein [Bacteroidota bacterium]|nr:cache domain-containing protein [Bacteroidota bacterium]
MDLNFIKKRDITIPIATKLILGFLLIVVITSAVFSVVGVQLIGDRIVSEAQDRVRTDLNSAREIYLSQLNHVNNVVRFTADRFFLKDALLSGKIKQATDELIKVKERERLDILTITDKSGKVLFRTSNLKLFGDDQSHDELVRAVIERIEPFKSTSIIPVNDLRKESPLLAERAYFKFIHTPKARVRKETEETAGMMLKAAAPILDYQDNLIGIIYGGVLLSRNFEIVDKIKQTVFQNVVYEGKDIGTATIFLDDIRISTNVKNEDGLRAIGTRGAEEVYNQVVKEGRPWIGRAFVVTEWYITAYEPIRNVNNKIVGILYVGILEQKYADIRSRTIILFLAITLMGAFVSMTLAYFISRKISGSVRKLVSASREVAHGNLDAKVEIRSKDELRELADSFNLMASALKKRDEKLKEFARKKIMESERLAIIGQLAADVAHEINNPLQGIVAYSHLLLEKMPSENSTKESINKIVTQANRCTDIIRGLLDFSRQRKPHKKSSDVNLILQECVSLVDSQALFHNIQIVKDFKENLPQIVIDPSQMQQVFMNMIINAAEAMDGNGQLALATRLEPAEGFIEVEFTDTGHGINEENLERIFDPFFTTKEMGHGTGLGLAISYGIIKEHEGTISVQSEVGKGTTVIVRLPVTTEERA